MHAFVIWSALLQKLLLFPVLSRAYIQMEVYNYFPVELVSWVWLG